MELITSENLFEGQKVTVALGQRGYHDANGCGGSFVVIEKQNGPDPIFVAGGGGPWVSEFVPPQSYARGLKGGMGGSSQGGFGGGGAKYSVDEHKFYCGAGGGFSGGSAEIREGSSKNNILSKTFGGGAGESFSIDKNAIFDYILVDYGKCKIEFLN